MVRCFRSFKLSVSSHSTAMQIKKFVIAALILTARICRAEIFIPTSSPDKATTSLVEGLVKIVTSCYGDQINGVGLAGDLPDTLARTLSVQHLIPATLMDDTSLTILPTTVDEVPDQFRYKLQVFVVGASSYNQLNTIIQLIIKTSIWWNHMASFLILNRSHECDDTVNFLYTPWILDLLNAKVMCYHHRYGDAIFNYNPFTNQAPAPWRRFNVVGARNNHPFTVFWQKYHGNEAICENLDFVKTKDLGGYEIRVEGTTRNFNFYDKNFLYLSRLVASRKRLFQILYGALNCTPKFSVTPDGSFTDAEMHSKYVELTLLKFSTTYPYQQHGLVLISQYRGHKSQLEKILYVIDTHSRIGLGIVYVVTLIFFKFFVHQDLGPALLNLVRITCNTAFANLTDNTASRMFLTGLLFFVVTMQGIYQGNLASLLTNKIPVRNVDSLEDLVKWGYKIYGCHGRNLLLEHADLKKRFIQTIDAHDCVAYVMHDSLAACIHDPDGGILDIARHNDLHISNKFITQIPKGFPIRKSWYLEEQMNAILGTIMEADIFESWDRQCNPIQLDDFKFDKEVLANTDFKIIEFAELSFAFVILGIGLLCATVTFIVEVAIYRYQQHNNCTIIVLHTKHGRESCAHGSVRCVDHTSENTHACNIAVADQSEHE